MRPSIVLLAGPNGAGKSTLYETRVAHRFAGPFINADIIQRDELRDLSMAASYAAARLADERRQEMLDARKSFATETVFSHPSKLEIIESAQRRDYRVVVMHVGVETTDLSVERVRLRHLDGGHDVPEEKIRTRFQRSQPLIRQAVLMADRGMVFDNSSLNQIPQQMVVFGAGRLISAAPVLPEWILSIYRADLSI